MIIQPETITIIDNGKIHEFFNKDIIGDNVDFIIESGDNLISDNRSFIVKHFFEFVMYLIGVCVGILI